MIKDKILIFHSFTPNINIGGPTGFFAHNLIGSKGKNYILSSQLQKRNKFIDKVSKKIKLLINNNSNNYFKNELERISNVYLTHRCSDFKIIFFHTCFELYACRHFLKKNQIIILQSHSPELPSEELKWISKNEGEILFMKEIEKFSFDRAQYIVFPNEGCVPIYNSVLKAEHKLEFLLSGSKRNETAFEYPLDKSKINILYIGRRNTIKGFDIILDNFKKVYELRKDIRLIVVGSGDSFEQEGVVDVGFSSTPLTWFNSVDYVINSNRQSYFDLSILEVLSIGTPIIMASNFGHAFFKGKSMGILTFEDEGKGLFDILIQLEKDEIKKAQMIRENLKLYSDLFTDAHYQERLEEMSKRIIINSDYE